ncbi:hypothetical protein OAC89_02965 [Deltaproteobacteria bacterium]|nr:hypothetical protein [Deltaproteobacteria bacterium]
MKKIFEINRCKFVKLVFTVLIAGSISSLSCHQTQGNEIILKKMPTLLVNFVNSDDPVNYAKNHGISLKNGMVRVIITVDESITSRDFLSQHDLKDYQWRENFVTAYVSIDELRALCKEPAIIYIRLPVKFDS